MSRRFAIPPYTIPLPPSPPPSPSTKDSSNALTSTYVEETHTPARTPSDSSSDRCSSPLNLCDAYAVAPGPQACPHSNACKAIMSSDHDREVENAAVQLSDFQLIRVIGRGCAGRVLLVKHTPTNAIRAMKAVSKRSVFAFDDLVHTLAEQSILKRFAIQEPDNAFIARLHHSFADRENFYFVMDFYPGGDLATQMELYGILGHHRTRFYASDIVQGLEDLHRNGIIMRDLKPENVLLNAKGHAVLADFGLAKEFEYRGDPKPLHVAAYPSWQSMPEWAGAGAASMRTMEDGSQKAVLDRAYSFVGTAEYLSPEVVKRGEYSYAVDWWALGCIILEGLIGRVPFRVDEDDPPVVMWNKVLLDPWHDVLKTPNIAQRPAVDYGLDTTTWHFVDSLLTKDPMCRLTEPFVKTHEYFAFIDWGSVQRGEYEDPHGLQLHSTVEYNTRYFPRLCLEQEPTVEMLSAEQRQNDEHNPTPLNDNQLFALAQARFKTELEGFTWSRSVDEEVVPETQCGIDAMDVDESPIAKSTSLTDGDPPMSSEQLEIPAEPLDGELEELHPEAGRQENYGGLRDTAGTVPEEAIKTKTEKSDRPASMSAPCAEHVGRSDAISKFEGCRPIGDQPPVQIEPSERPRESSASVPILVPPRPEAHCDFGSRSALPTELPSSGLSVSDIVSIPSSMIGTSHRLLHRHGLSPLPESIPIARLSVEMNGKVLNLDDEEWEELSGEGIESIPNGPHQGNVPSTFFSRGFRQILRRRSSTLANSGLRHQTTKTSESSRESSPSKSRPLPSPGLFAAKSIGSTKRAFERFKAFPKLKRGGEGKIALPPRPSPHEIVETEDELRLSARPANSRHHTESGSGWFDKRARMRKRESASTPPTSKESGSSYDDYIGKVPRVELTTTPPLMWEVCDESGRGQ